MELIFWLFILFTLIYEPIFGYFDFKKFKQEVKQKQKARLKFYKRTMLGLWLPALFILALVYFTEISHKDIGLSLPALNTEPLGPILTYTVLAVGIVYFIGILYYALGWHLSQKVRVKLAEASQKEWENVSYSALLPVTDKEQKWWNYVSLTAGITEEIIYRGFLLFAFTQLFPDFSIWFSILVSSFIFGLAHTYQGFVAGVVRTTIVGVIFSSLYIGIGSILPIIVLHFFIDYIAKLGEKQTESDTE